MDARNDHVKQGLRRVYAAKVPNGKLDVFCVSNRMYEENSRKGKAEGVMASGIPDLRKFCHTITADAQYREARHFLQSSLFSLLTSLDIRMNRLNTADEQRVVSDATRCAIHAEFAKQVSLDPSKGNIFCRLTSLIVNRLILRPTQ